MKSRRFFSSKRGVIISTLLVMQLVASDSSDESGLNFPSTVSAQELEKVLRESGPGMSPQATRRIEVIIADRRRSAVRGQLRSMQLQEQKSDTVSAER